MLRIVVRMQAWPEKRRELIQTLHELTGSMRHERGFLNGWVIRCRKGDSGTVVFVKEWETREAAYAYLQSNYFSVLRGALKILTSSWKITCSPELSTVSEIQSTNIAGTIQEDTDYENAFQNHQALAS